MPIRSINLNKIFGEKNAQTHVLHDISVNIQDGEMVALTGRSGSGKSTLLYILSSLDYPTSGTCWLDDNDISKMNSHEVHSFRNKNMGFVFQFHHLIPELTALENILMPALKYNEEKKYRPYALELLKEFSLADKANRFPSQLSGGEQQRVAIARALVMSPKYIFADEPTGNLDTINGDIVMKLFQKINLEKKTTIVYVTHDMNYANLSKRKIILVDGRVS